MCKFQKYNCHYKICCLITHCIVVMILIIIIAMIVKIVKIFIIAMIIIVTFQFSNLFHFQKYLQGAIQSQ